MANPIQVGLALAAADDDGISASQSPGAGAITIDGALASGGVATLDAARRVILTSGGNDTGITFTVIGTNANGKALTEAVTGASGAAASTTQDFKTVTSITHTGTVAGTLKVGTSGVGSTPWQMLNFFDQYFTIGVGVVVSGTINFTVEYTYDNPNSPYTGTFPTAFSISDLATKIANTSAAFGTPVYAVRLTQNSFTYPGTAKMIVIQSGDGA